MIIERFSLKYYGDIVLLVKNFHNDTLNEYGISLDLNALEDTITELKHELFLLTTNDKCEGVLAGKPVEVPYSKDKIWHEVMWYVNKDYRKHGIWLLREATKKLKEEGYTKMVMVSMENNKDRISRVYEHLKFVPMETHWIRSL